MSDPAPGLSTIGQILIPVRDIERATAYYRDVLGLPFLFAFPRMAFFDAGGVRLYLSQPESAAFDGRATIYFRVADIAATVGVLERRGATFADRPHVVHRDAGTELWMAFTRDPDGNNVALMSEVPAAG
jgi:catechol 2,3-dioxygenase-like lactoylglutathione lyase family enzyme